jgi:hypothetical protein
VRMLGQVVASEVYLFEILEMCEEIYIEDVGELELFQSEGGTSLSDRDSCLTFWKRSIPRRDSRWLLFKINFLHSLRYLGISLMSLMYLF